MPDNAFYEAFLAEMEKVTVMADAPAVAVVGVCTRAAKRAQMAMDGESVSPGPWLVSATNPGVDVVQQNDGDGAPE